MSVTPSMDREFIKRMAHSLVAYSKVRSLVKMSQDQLADMPKEVIIGCAAHEIAIVWDKLPTRLQNDIDIMKYQYCEEHHTENNTPDVNDGPIPQKIFCCYCRLSDVHVATNNDIDIMSSPPTNRRLRHLCCYQQ